MKRNKPSKITADGLRKQIRKKPEKEEQEGNYLWIPTGSIMFNLGCSDRIDGGYKTGGMANLIGDSSSGKSILALSGLAEMANNPKFNEYRLIYDDAEFGNSFDMRKLFGDTLLERLEGPNKDPEKFSTTIEEFYDYVFDVLDSNSPFIYVLDSFDALDAEAEMKKAMENREKRKKEKAEDQKGSYDAVKQKKASQMFRQITGRLKKTNSFLLVISQTRDNLSPTGRASQRRAGGRALKFYSSIETWLAHYKGIKKTVNAIEHVIGMETKARISKDKYTGKRKEPHFYIYYDYGVDNIGSCIDFLLKNKWWETKKQTIIASDLEIEASKPKLIQEIEDQELEQELFAVTEKCWQGVEAKLKLDRKRKFE